jgi:hypothetical protein
MLLVKLRARKRGLAFACSDKLGISSQLEGKLRNKSDNLIGACLERFLSLDSP